MMLTVYGILIVLCVPVVHSSCDPKWTFTCDDGTCITISRRCNNRRDCLNGEDETDCGTSVASCNERNEREIRYSGYKCSKTCLNNKDCMPNQRCVCDDECGKSCVNERIRCEDLPNSIPGSSGYYIIRFENDEKNLLSNINDFKVGDMVSYKCENGRSITGPFPRCSSNGKWTKVKPQCIDFSKCGQAGQVRLKNILQNNRIVHGDDSTATAWPWYAMITEKKWNAYMTFNKCSLLGGGSLINNKWVLTAAHLFSYFYPGKGHADSDWFKEIVVALGVHEKPNGNVVPSNVQVFEPEMILIHESFKELTYEKDIALIKLGNRIDTKTMETNPNTNTGVEFNYYIRPVCLPCSGSCYKVKLKKQKLRKNSMRRSIQMCKIEAKSFLRKKGKVVVTGFGHTKTKQPRQDCISVPPNLQQGQLQVLPKAECKKAVTEINVNRTSSKMIFNNNFICCIGKDKEKLVDACQGDSGGPVVRKVSKKKSPDSCWTQIGIVSWGVGCGTGRPGFYTNVATFARWINDTINGYDICLRPTENRGKMFLALKFSTNPNDGDVPRLAADSLSSRQRCAVQRRKFIPGGAPRRQRKEIRRAFKSYYHLKEFLDRRRFEQTRKNSTLPLN